MKRLLTGVFLLSIGVGFSSSADGQSATPQVLLRLERVQRGEAACVLVQDDGSYRLEKLFRAKTEMYTGTIEPQRLDQLRLLLTDDKLRKLSEKDIQRPLMTDTVDSLDLSIWRDRGWQNLSFFSPADRRPFRESIDPLLQWFQDVVKQRPTATAASGTPTRCLPPPTVIVSATSDTAHSVPAAPVAHLEPGYLFRVQSTQFHAGLLEKTCTVVFSDGAYRWESRTEDFSGRKRGRAGNGEIERSALEELKQVLDSPDLKSAPAGNTPDVLAQNWQGVTLDVPRGSEVQHVMRESAFNTRGNPLEPGGMSNLGYQVNSQKVLEPLKRWMKQHSSNHGGAVDQTSGNDCYPEKAALKP